MLYVIHITVSLSSTVYNNYLLHTVYLIHWFIPDLLSSCDWTFSFFWISSYNNYQPATSYCKTDKETDS